MAEQANGKAGGREGGRMVRDTFTSVCKAVLELLAGLG